jgi:hypothetical protein
MKEPQYVEGVAIFDLGSVSINVVEDVVEILT